jgi:hypothetical protein
VPVSLIFFRRLVTRIELREKQTRYRAQLNGTDCAAINSGCARENPLNGVEVDIAR